MNKEIKECIEDLLTVACCPAHDESCKKVYDYITNLHRKLDKATNYYLKTLSKNEDMPKEAVEMFNLLEGNK